MYLCLCIGISTDEFLEKTQKLDKQDFNKICQITQVGSQCGLCKNQAECILKKEKKLLKSSKQATNIGP